MCLFAIVTRCVFDDVTHSLLYQHFADAAFKGPAVVFGRCNQAEWRRSALIKKSFF